jgi:glutamine synthetase
MIDLRFTDLRGVAAFSVPPSAVNANTLDEGVDSTAHRSVVSGDQESDMLVVPDPTTAFLDPFTPATTLV